MKISIKSSESKNINIKLPMGIITTFIRFGKLPSKIKIDNGAKMIVNEIFKHDNKKTIIKGLKYLNKHHKGLVLVDVEDTNGDIVKIEI